MPHPTPSMRFGTRALLACSLLSASTATAQQAYFSIEGEITNVLGRHDVFFDLPTGAATTDDLFFLTYNNAGLTNAAGDATQASDVDPVLDLFSFNAGVSVSNDDGADGPNTGLDSLLSWPGVATSGGTLPGTGLPAADDYRLTFRDFGDDSVGWWGVDAVGPASKLVLTQLTPDAANPGGVSVLRSLKFGTTGAGTTKATFDYIGLSTLEITDDVVVAQTGNALLQHDQGTIHVGGTLTLNTNGDYNLNGGTLDLDGDLVIAGGDMNIATPATLDRAAGTTVTVNNGGNLTHNPGATFSGTDLNISGGGSATFRGFFGLGTSDDGTVTVDGAGSSFTIDSNFNTFWGQNSNAATLNVTNDAGAMVDFAGSIDLAASSNASTTGTFNVNTGGDLTLVTPDLRLANGNASATAVINLAGTGSTITHTGSGALTVGGTGTGSATINIDDNAVFTTGTGTTTIHANGLVEVTTGGTFNAKGDLTITGGSLTVDNTSTFDPEGDITVDSGSLQHLAWTTFTMASGKNLTAQNNAQLMVTVTGGNIFAVHQGQTFEVFSGADLTSGGGTLLVGSGVGDGTLTVSGAGSTLTQNGVLGIAQSSSTGLVTIQDSATATITSGARVARSFSDAGMNGTLTIQTGGDLTTTTILVGDNDGDQGTGTINVDGTGSTLTQTGASALVLGNADTPGNGGVHTLNAINDGQVLLGTGTHTINKTGIVNINTGGFLSVPSDLNVVGGRINNTGNGANFDGLGLVNGATLTASDEAVLTFQGSYQINNDATIQITDGADWTVEDVLDIGLVSDGTVIVDGVGSTLFANTAQNFPQSIRVGPLLAKGMLTVRNSAVVGANGTTMTIAGTGIADSEGHVNVQSGGRLNTLGIIMTNLDEGTATLTVTGEDSLLFDAGSAGITIGSGGDSSATVTVADTATFITGTGLLTVNPTGAVAVNSGAQLNVNGAITNITGGTVNINDADSRLNLALNATINVTQGGALRFNSDRQQDLYAVSDGRTFNVLSGATLRHAGRLEIGQGGTGTVIVGGEGSILDVGTRGLAVGRPGGTGQLTLRSGAAATVGSSVNIGELGSVGRIDIESGATLTLTGNSSLTLANLGATGGTATLNLLGQGTALNMPANGVIRLGNSIGGNSAMASLSSGAAINTSSLIVNTDGVFTLDAATLNATLVQTAGTGLFNFTSGTMRIQNYIGNLLQQGGVLQRNGDTGVINVAGDYTQTAGALEVRVGGPIAGDYDEVIVNNNATFAGTLDVMLIDDFMPRSGQRYDILDFTAVSGTFATLNLPTLQGALQWDTTDLYTTGELAVFTTLPADLSGDGDVDDEDLGLFFSAFTGPDNGPSSNPFADLSGDGDVDDEDLGQAFSQFTGPLTPVSIPEPGSLLLLALGGLIASRRR